MLRFNAFSRAGLFASTAHFVAHTPIFPGFVNTVDRARLFFARRGLERFSDALLSSVFGHGKIALPLSSSDTAGARHRTSAELGPVAPATVNHALDLCWSDVAGIGRLGGSVLTSEEGCFVSFADDVGDQEGFGGGSGGGDASGADEAHLTAGNVAGLLVESLAADGFERIGFRLVDFDLTFSKDGAAQTNRILTSQARARLHLFSRAHAPSVLADESVVETRSGSLLGALAAGGGSVAGGPGGPFAKEWADSHVTRLELNVAPVTIQSASGSFGCRVDATSASDLHSLVAAHGAIAESCPFIPFGLLSLLLAVFSLPIGVDADALVLPSSLPVAALDAASVVFAGVRLAQAKGVTVHAHVGASVVSGAIFGFQILRVCLISVVVENAARSLKKHIEGLASRVFDAHLCAE